MERKGKGKKRNERKMGKKLPLQKWHWKRERTQAGEEAGESACLSRRESASGQSFSLKGTGHRGDRKS